MPSKHWLIPPQPCASRMEKLRVHGRDLLWPLLSEHLSSTSKFTCPLVAVGWKWHLPPFYRWK